MVSGSNSFECFRVSDKKGDEGGLLRLARNKFREESQNLRVKGTSKTTSYLPSVTSPLESSASNGSTSENNSELTT